jgi:hypothetical protein
VLQCTLDGAAVGDVDGRVVRGVEYGDTCAAFLERPDDLAPDLTEAAGHDGYSPVEREEVLGHER